jgi:hypothetical protein
MELLKQLKELENIQSIEELKKAYSTEELKDFYKKTEFMIQISDELFQKTVKKSSLLSEDVEPIWKLNQFLNKIRILLVKTIMLIEREQILEDTVNLTDKLSRLITTQNKD